VSCRSAQCNECSGTPHFLQADPNNAVQEKRGLGLRRVSRHEISSESVDRDLDMSNRSRLVSMNVRIN